MLDHISFPVLQTKHEDTIWGEKEKTEKIFKFRFLALFAQVEIETSISQNFAPIWKQNSPYSVDIPIIIVIPSSLLIKKHSFRVRRE